MVQACHALAHFLLRHADDPDVREWAERHRTLVILGVDDEHALKTWRATLARQRVACEGFVEPDFGDQLTALAVHPNADRSLFRRLRLL